MKKSLNSKIFKSVHFLLCLVLGASLYAAYDFLSENKVVAHTTKTSSVSFIAENEGYKLPFLLPYERYALEDSIVIFEIEIKSFQNTIDKYGDIIQKQKIFIEDANLYLEYLDKHAEWLVKKDYIFNIYHNRSAYLKLAKIVKERPELSENADVYTKENIILAQEAIDESYARIDIEKQLIREKKLQIEKMKDKLAGNF